MTLADQISKDRGQPATVRIGIVASVSPLVVSVQGTDFQDVGILGWYAPAVGDVVALLGQSAVSADGSSWLVLGEVAPGASGALSATVASGVDTTGVTTASAVYVPLTGSLNPSLVFAGPLTGRILVHWRSDIFAGAGNAARVSFRIGLGAVIGAGTVVQAASDAVSLQSFLDVSAPGFGSTALVSGLTPDTVYNIEMQHRRPSGAGVTSYNNRQITVQPAP